VQNLAQKEWRMPPREWAMAKARFAIMFEGRFKLRNETGLYTEILTVSHPIFRLREPSLALFQLDSPPRSRGYRC